MGRGRSKSRVEKQSELRIRHSGSRWLSGLWATVTGIATLVGLAVVLLGGSASLSAGEQQLEDMRPKAIAANCRSYDTPYDSRYVDLVVANLKCEALGDGAESVKFHLFTNETDLREYMRLQRSEVEGTSNDCTDSGFPWRSPWVDRRGKVRGELLCADFVANSALVWSYDKTLVAAAASSSPDHADDLHLWWQHKVKLGGGSPLEERRRLLGLLPPAFGACRPMPLLDPAALAGVLCQPGKGITAAGAESFPNRKLLAAFLDGHAGEPGVDEEGCDVSPFSYTPYGPSPDQKPLLGKLLCRPEHGAEWFEWSAINPKVYAFAARADSNVHKLYEQWVNFLSRIRGVEQPANRR